MDKKWWGVFAVFCLTLLLSPLAGWAQKEVEPNNTEDKATVVGTGIVHALANDSHDWFKVSLPTAGPVTLRVTGLPPGMNVQIGVKGLAPLRWRDGQGDTEYRFEAKNTEGLVWVMFQFAQNVCGYDWCAARMVPGGPWYGVRPSAKMPAAHNGEPILREALPYSLVIEAAGATGPAAATTASSNPGSDSRDGSIQWEGEPDDDPAPPGQIIWEDEAEDDPESPDRIDWEDEPGIQD
jgi:hypothetical protein